MPGKMKIQYLTGKGAARVAQNSVIMNPPLLHALQDENTHRKMLQQE
jgi:hypothetical protein